MNAKHPYIIEEMQRIAALDLPFEKFEGKTIAVTGAGGLVGNYLTRALCAIRDAKGLNMRIAALCRNKARTREQLSGLSGIEYVNFDAEDSAPVDFTADFIVHAASNAHPRAFSEDPVGTMRANIFGTLRLLESLRGGRLLFISSGETYGENPAVEAYKESDFGKIDTSDPRACYPESKRAAEALCSSFARQYGADAVVARLGYVFGGTASDRSTRADAQFLFKAVAGEDIVMKSPGTQIRSYCYAADATAALLTILLKGETPQAYNVSSPDCVCSVRYYAQKLADAAGVKLCFDIPEESKEQGYSKVTRAVLDSGKLMGLGWKPVYGMEEALKRTFAIAKG